MKGWKRSPLFETKKKPKEERTRRVEVRDERDRNKEKPKKGSPTAPPLDDEAGVGDVGERFNPIRLKSRLRTPSRSPSRAAPALAGGFGPAAFGCQECSKCSHELETRT